MNILIIIKLFRKKAKNKNSIRNLIYANGIVSLAILFLVSCCALAGNDILTSSFYTNLIQYSISITIYTAVWTSYFKVSNRVDEYYSEEKEKIVVDK